METIMATLARNPMTREKLLLFTHLTMSQMIATGIKITINIMNNSHKDRGIIPVSLLMGFMITG